MMVLITSPYAGITQIR